MGTCGLEPLTVASLLNSLVPQATLLLCSSFGGVCLVGTELLGSIRIPHDKGSEKNGKQTPQSKSQRKKSTESLGLVKNRQDAKNLQ